MTNREIIRTFIKIEGINNHLARLLVNAGINSLDKLINTPTTKIKEITKISENEIIDWVYEAKKLQRTAPEIEPKMAEKGKKSQELTYEGKKAGIFIGKKNAFYSIYESGSTILSFFIMLAGSILFSLSLTITNFDQLIQLYESLPFISQSIALEILGSSTYFYWGVFTVLMSIIIGGWIIISLLMSATKKESSKRIIRTLGFSAAPALFFAIVVILKFVDSKYLFYSFKAAILPLSIIFLSFWVLIIVIRGFQSLAKILDQYSYVGVE
jgi:hypothetical protein